MTDEQEQPREGWHWTMDIPQREAAMFSLQMDSVRLLDAIHRELLVWRAERHGGGGQEIQEIIRQEEREADQRLRHRIERVLADNEYAG